MSNEVLERGSQLSKWFNAGAEKLKVRKIKYDLLKELLYFTSEAGIEKTDIVQFISEEMDEL